MQEESHVIKLNFLSRAMERLSKSKTLEEVSSEIFDFIQSIIDYTMAIIYLIDYEKKQLMVIDARGSNINNIKKRIKFKLGQGVVGWAAKEKKAIVLEDALLEKNIKVRQRFDIDPLIRSYIAVPLITSDHVIGILSISHSEPNLYDIKDVQIISIIASQAAALFEINKMMKVLQEHVRQADHLAAFGKYMAGLAHEIRNPLLPIRTAASVLINRQTLGEEDKKLIKIIHTESERLNAFMDNINQLVKPSEPESKGIGAELTAAINEILPLIELKCKKHNISIKMNFNYARGKFFVRLSPGQIKQIFLNLFLNSIDAIGQNGTISIKIDREKDMAKIIFSDTGCGISEQDMSKVFEPFYSTKSDGTGLGLSIVHSIVHNAGGKIDVASEIKKGCHFTVILPCAREVRADGPD